MAKYKDRFKNKATNSNVPYIEGESAADRHARRQAEAEHRDKKSLENYCRSNGFQMSVTNEGLHWQIRHGKTQIDWWPRTAKMVVNKQWESGIHVHDVRQIKAYLVFCKLLKVSE